MARGRSLRGSSNSRPSRHGTRHISISKLLMAVFALTTSSCSALIADPKPTHTGLSVQREITLDDPLINVYLRVRSAEPTDHSTTATNSRFSTSETATPVSTPTSSNSTSSSSSSSSLTASYTGVPQPFDSPLGTNFSTKTCPELFRKIIGDPLVRNCVPLSMLIQVYPSPTTMRPSNE